MFNVASCIMVTPVSYHGGVGHKPVILGIGALVMSAGAMVFASPHFIAPQYLVLESGSTNLCPEHGPGKCSLTGRGTNANAFKYFFMLYTQCTCVNGPTLSTPLDNDTLFYYMAKRDPCSPDCNLVLVYAGAIFIALFFTFLLIVPALTALLRSIDEDVKSTGIGVNYVAIRLLGMMST
ncbi:hypothetical protein V5799_029290 [Amblyomma americanum]|uniref:Organic anion transporter n=1 Tax=Amblyomma americanum TaxID=6943 RepID=A0AAQ4ERS4_AMBAM